MYGLARLIMSSGGERWTRVVVLGIVLLLVVFNPVARDRRAERGKCLLYLPAAAWIKPLAIFTVIIHFCVVGCMIWFRLNSGLNSSLWKIYWVSLLLPELVLWYGYYIFSFRVYKTGLVGGAYGAYDKGTYEWKYITGWQRVSESCVVFTVKYVTERELTIRHLPQHREQLDALLAQYIVPRDEDDDEDDIDDAEE